MAREERSLLHAQDAVIFPYVTDRADLISKRRQWRPPAGIPIPFYLATFGIFTRDTEDAWKPLSGPHYQSLCYVGN